MNEELLPCPFCGEAAEVVQHDRTLDFNIVCHGKECFQSTIWPDREGMVKAWNTRKG